MEAEKSVPETTRRQSPRIPSRIAHSKRIRGWETRATPQDGNWSRRRGMMRYGVGSTRKRTGPMFLGAVALSPSTFRKYAARSRLFWNPSITCLLLHQSPQDPFCFHPPQSSAVFATVLCIQPAPKPSNPPYWPSCCTALLTCAIGLPHAALILTLAGLLLDHRSGDSPRQPFHPSSPSFGPSLAVIL